ncbi:response regulator [Halarcobacter anaerophilus]|uniref:response regulator n=1 Tax=Halarcobacter anaerophilus TaxID=877500 RepID=UPI000698FA9A|nr:response regulator [Halarcobacter anaerophilus]
MKSRDFNILIVEDEFIAFEYLKNILLSLDFNNIFQAKSAKESIEIVKKQHIDLALMDINIEGNLDGIECARVINKDYFIPIIYTTAYGDTNTINETKQSNVFGYLVKPFSLQDVEATIKVVIHLLSKFNKEKKNKETEALPDFIALTKDYKFYPKTATLTYKEEPISLTKKELSVLNFFCRNINQNISYDTMREYIWYSKSVSSSTIRDTVSRLKNKIPEVEIENIINFGYILKKDKS